MFAMASNFIFVDEAGDPGQPYLIEADGTKQATGASKFYIITAICLDEKKLFLLEQRMMEVKNTFGYKKEIKTDDISLPLYEALLKIINELGIQIYYRLIDKEIYKGQFKVAGIPKLHNVFDEFNVARTVAFAVVECGMIDVDVVIDRTDRRLLDGKYDSFNTYLISKVRKIIGEEETSHIRHITHVDSKYVNSMQMSDIVGGALRYDFTKKNENLLKIIDAKNLMQATGKHERKAKKRWFKM